MNRFSGLLVLPAIMVLLFSCRPTKNATRISVNDNKATPFLLQQLKQNEFKFDWISAKFEAHLILDSTNASFTATMRAKKDSAIWISISPALGIEVARALLTHDSVKILDRINLKYFSGNYSYLNSILKADFDFDIIQSLLTGNSLTFEEGPDHLKSAVDKKNNAYLLSTVSKRKVKKAIRKDGYEHLLQSIWLEPEHFKVSKMLIMEPSDQKRSIDVCYSDFKNLETQHFAHKILLKIFSEKLINANLEYSKVSFEKPQKMPFNIPEKYVLLK